MLCTLDATYLSTLRVRDSHALVDNLALNVRTVDLFPERLGVALDLVPRPFDERCQSVRTYDVVANGTTYR